MEKFTARKIVTLFILTSSLMLTGCAGTFHDVKSKTVSKPPTVRPSTLVVQNITIKDARISPPAAANYLTILGDGIVSWNTNHMAFSQVIVASGVAVPDDAIILSGTIHDVEKGSGSMRFWVGMGAGQARVQGNFEIKDSHGNLLCSFFANRSYLGGTGLGGMGMLDFDELFNRLGWVLAETTDKWLKGQKID